MSDPNQEKIAEFCSITGASAERASFFLQASGWDTQVAISAFYENDGQMESPSTTPEPLDTHNQTQPVTNQSSQRAPSSRIQTFSSLAAGAESDEDGEEGQAFYAGGSEESGQQILGPRRPKKGADDHIAEEIFKAAKQHGAEVVSESERGNRPAKPSSFVGTGYRLGESVTEPNQAVPGANKPAQPMNIVLKLWKAGFTINDGPQREYSDPQNQQFLQSIQRGEIPQELVSLAKGGEIALDMENHRTEDYEPPKEPKYKAFAGSGQTLGATSSSQVSSAAAVTANTREIKVDANQPTTNIQIRLSDGSRLVGKFNHSHTVGDIRQYIVTNRPQYSGVPFTLMTTLPNRQLTVDSQTIQQADLLNAVIVQKL